LELPHRPTNVPLGTLDRAQAVAELDVGLAAPANDHLLDPGFLDRKAIPEAASFTLGIQIVLVEIEHGLGTIMQPSAPEVQGPAASAIRRGGWPLGRIRVSGSEAAFPAVSYWTL